MRSKVNPCSSRKGQRLSLFLVWARYISICMLLFAEQSAWNETDTCYTEYKTSFNDNAYYFGLLYANKKSKLGAIT